MPCWKSKISDGYTSSSQRSKTYVYDKFWDRELKFPSNGNIWDSKHYSIIINFKDIILSKKATFNFSNKKPKWNYVKLIKTKVICKQSLKWTYEMNGNNLPRMCKPLKKNIFLY